MKEYKDIEEMFFDLNRKKNIVEKIIDFLDIHILRNLINIFHPVYNYRRLIRLWQRITRGWDDSELWNLNENIGKLVSERLKRFRELMDIFDGIPSSLILDVKEDHPGLDEDQVTNLAIERWKSIVEKIITAFELIGDSRNVLYTIDEEGKSYNEIYKEIIRINEESKILINEGIDLFKQYHDELWN